MTVAAVVTVAAVTVELLEFIVVYIQSRDVLQCCQKRLYVYLFKCVYVSVSVCVYIYTHTHTHTH